MFKRLSLLIGRQAVMAAIVGSACGAVAAMWSVGPHARNAPAAQASPTEIVTGPPSLPAGETLAADAVIRPGAPPSPASVPLLAEPRGDVRRQAQALAARPDVKALVALRESVVRHAENGGEAQAESSRQLLDDLDRYLEGARELRLKLDAEEFQRTRPLR
jgi:hypothetical protein